MHINWYNYQVLTERLDTAALTAAATLFWTNWADPIYHYLIDQHHQKFRLCQINHLDNMNWPFHTQTGLSCVKLQCRDQDGSGSFNKSILKSLSAALCEGEDKLHSKGIILLSTGLVTVAVGLAYAYTF